MDLKDEATMSLFEKTADPPKPAPRPTEAECMAVHRLLFAGKATLEESRAAVRYLLRQASRSLDPRA